MRKAAGHSGRSRPLRYVLGIMVPSVAFAVASNVSFVRAGVLLEFFLALGVAVANWLAGPIPGVIAAAFAALLYARFRLPVQWGSNDVLKFVTFVGLSAASGYATSRYYKRRTDLLSENKQLQAILEWVPIGIGHFGLDRKVKFCNPALWQMYGLEEGELHGQSLPLPQERKAEWRALEDRLRRGEPFLNVKTVRMRKDGSMFTAYISGVPLFDGSGEVSGVVGLIIEADELPAPQVEFEDLMALADSSSDFLMLLDTDLRIVYANEGVGTLAGRDASSVQGTHVLDYFAGDQRAKVGDYLRESLKSEQSTEYQPVLRMKNKATGTEVPVRFKIHPIYRSSARTLVSIACVAKDLEAEKDLLEQLRLTQRESRALFETMPIGIVKLNTDGLPIACNKRFQEIMGYTEEELKRLPFSTFVYPEDLKTGRELFLQLAAGQIDHYEIHKRLVDRHGNIFRTKMTVNLMRDREGRPDHTISMIEPMPGDLALLGGEKSPYALA
jgi:PAS domain S-box-containing protein